MPSPEGCNARRRVLFVSADADLRAVASRVLTREGYDVAAAAHSGHALLMCWTSEFDVVVAELSGPDVSGPTLVQQLKRHNRNLTAVYLSNPGTPEGVENVLVRPFTSVDLIDGIQLALSGVTA